MCPSMREVERPRKGVYPSHGRQGPDLQQWEHDEQIFQMAVGMKWTGDRPMAACTRYSGDDLDTGAIHPSQQKMTKRQQMGSK